MPTIPELPAAVAAGEADELPISQNGITRSVTVTELLAGTQPSIEIPSATLLGRVSLGPGAPEAVLVGTGLAVAGANIVANGGDHASFASSSALASGDEVILNSDGIPKRLPAALIRSLFNAGANVAIDGSGDISASTDPSVTTSLTSLGSTLSALAAEIPAGGVAGLNAQGQVTAPMAGDVGLGTVSVGSGCPARTLIAKSTDVYNVLDFGARTGGSDSTAAFNAAFAALPATGGDIFIPAGDYHLASALTWAGKPVVIRGAGKGQTRIHLQHTGIGFDITQTNPNSKVIVRDMSVYAENTMGQTAAVVRLTFPAEPSFGYVSAHISDVECFGYPNSNNGTAPFPQTFLRGFILNNCWSTQLNNISWFGPPAAAGATSSAVIEVNGSVDTRILGLQAYGGHAAVIQTGYCEGIYFTNPLLVGLDYLFCQTDITTWPGYQHGKLMLLGLWAANGEVNINLAAVKAASVGGGYFVGLEITRNGGPTNSQSLFDLTDVSNFYVLGCNILGGPSGGPLQDVAFDYHSTFNSSNNAISTCTFANMATIVRINGSNGTVGLMTSGLNVGNVPLSTAVIDQSAPNVSNRVSFQAPALSYAPAGIASTTDHILSSPDGSVSFRVGVPGGSANFVHVTPATSSNPPTLAFDGTDGTINGVIQTKGGALFINASGGSSGSGNMLSLMNIQGSTNWVVIQNATQGNLSTIGTNAGGLAIQSKTSLWLSPTTGLYMSGLPTSKPAQGSNQVWSNNGTLCIA